LDRKITSLSTSRKCFIVNRLTEEGDLKGFKMAWTHFGSNCPSRARIKGFLE
jgi:hypothetical protein